MVDRRVNGEPIPRIMGHYTFRGLDMLVKEGVFVPRASSEFLAAEAVKAMRWRRGHRVAVDVATGAGPVALAIANEVRGAEVWGIDISAEATALGREHSVPLPVSNVVEQIIVQAINRGWGEASGYMATYQLQEEAAGVSLKASGVDPKQAAKYISTHPEA